MAAESWRIVLITSGRKVTSELLPVVSSEIPAAQVIEVQGYPANGNLAGVDASGAICMVDLMTDRAAGLRCLESLAAGSLKVPPVVLVPANDPQLILQALRTGAKDFLTHPFSQEQLREVFNKLANLLPELAVDQGRVIAVVPAKGACGASTLAFNLAVQLRKASGGRTLLADLDPATGTQAFQMKLKPAFSFLDALQQSSNLDADIWKGIVQVYQGLDVLLPPENPIESAQEVADALPLLDFSRRLYKNVIVDVGIAYGDWPISILRSADDILLVTTNELPALQAAQRVMGYYDSRSLSRQKIHLVINRFSREVGLSKDMVETALQTDVYQLLPSDYEGVQAALLDGKPILTSSAFGKQVSMLAGRLLGTQGAQPRATQEKVRPSGALSGLFSLFSRST